MSDTQTSYTLPNATTLFMDMAGQGFVPLGQMLSPRLVFSSKKREKHMRVGGIKRYQESLGNAQTAWIEFETQKTDLFVFAASFMTTTETTVPAGTKQIDDEIMLLHAAYSAATALPLANMPTVISVTSLDGLTTYVEDTDYTVAKEGITRISSGAISEGQALRVSYEAALPPHIPLSPFSGKPPQGPARLIMESRTGQSFLWEIEKTELHLEPPFIFQNDDWIKSAMRLIIMDNSLNEENAPYGKLLHWENPAS